MTMDSNELQARKNQLYGYLGTAKALAMLLDMMQISGIRSDMRRLEELTTEIKRMN